MISGGTGLDAVARDVDRTGEDRSKNGGNRGEVLTAMENWTLMEETMSEGRIAKRWG